MENKYLYSIFIDNSETVFPKKPIFRDYTILDEMKVSDIRSRSFTRNQIALALCEIAEYYECDIERTLLWIYVSTFMKFNVDDFYYVEEEVEVNSIEDLVGIDLDQVMNFLDGSNSKRQLKRWYYKNNS